MTKFQLTVIEEPFDPSEDMRYFTEHSEKFQQKIEYMNSTSRPYISKSSNYIMCSEGMISPRRFPNLNSARSAQIFGCETNSGNDLILRKISHSQLLLFKVKIVPAVHPGNVYAEKITFLWILMSGLAETVPEKFCNKVL